METVWVQKFKFTFQNGSHVPGGYGVYLSPEELGWGVAYTLKNPRYSTEGSPIRLEIPHQKLDRVKLIGFRNRVFSIDDLPNPI